MSFSGEINGDLNVAGSLFLSGTRTVTAIPSQSNYFVGTAGNLTTTASALTAMGSDALASIGGADGNTAMGYSAMKFLVSGGGNTAFGDRALASGTAFIDMTAVGSRALFSNQDGVGCTAIGVESQYNNLHGGNNASVGDISLFSNTIGTGLAAFGYACLHGNVDGIQNCGFGQSALYTNQSGSQNVAIGYSAMQLADSGSGNVAVGSSALLHATTGENTALGYLSLSGVSSGLGNTGVGASAGAAVTTGTYNVFVGHSSGTGGSQLVSVNNSVAIGYGAVTTADNQVVLGAATVTQTVLNGTLYYGSGPSLISSPSAGVHQFGGPDVAVPVRQTLKAQSAAAGNTNAAGADLIIAGSCGTGSGNGGAVRIQVSPPGSSGSTQNALLDAIVVSRTRETTFMQNVTVMAAFNLFWQGRTGLASPVDGVLRIRNNAGSIYQDLNVPALYTLQLGGADIAAPNPQTLKAQSVLTGTTDTAGADFAINGSAGTGTGSGGGIKFQTAPAGGSTGSTPNSYVTAMAITGAGAVGVNTAAPDYALEALGSFGFAPGATVTPVKNGDVIFELTNDTTLTIKARGSDGVVRSGTITLT